MFKSQRVLAFVLIILILIRCHNACERRCSDLNQKYLVNEFKRLSANSSLLDTLLKISFNDAVHVNTRRVYLSWI